MPLPGHIVCFGPFQLDPRAAELRFNGNRIQLPEQPFQVLTALLEKPGEVVTRDELRQRLWGADTFVDFEHGLNTAVKRLRAALGDSAEDPRYIETLPRHGYRLMVPVERAEPVLPETSEVAVRRWKIWLVVSIAVVVAVAAGLLWRQRLAEHFYPVKIESLAVLPLENLSGSPEEEYFTDGMTEALITELGKIHALRVISRQSVMQYKGTTKTVPQIARELRVDAVVEGSALRSGSKVRITTQLILSNPERHLWSESYERNLSDVITVQREMTQAIARELRVAMTLAERTQLASLHNVNAEAHELYLRGRYHWWKRTAPDMAKAIASFERAIAIEPDYAAAYAGLADAYSISANNGFEPPSVGKEKAKRAAIRAIQLDDSLAEGHLALGMVYAFYEWNWAQAEHEIRRALDFNPNYAFAYLIYAEWLKTFGRHDEAIAAIRRAQQLDPLATRINFYVVYILYCAHRYDEAVAAAQKLLALEPDDGSAHYYLGAIYLQKGMMAEALAELERGSRILLTTGQTPVCCAKLAIAYSAAGKPAKARRLIATWLSESKRTYKAPSLLAEAYLSVGDDAQVFAWLEKAYEEHDPHLDLAPPTWDRLRSDVRFKDLLRRMNLPQ